MARWGWRPRRRWCTIFYAKESHTKWGFHQPVLVIAMLVNNGHNTINRLLIEPLRGIDRHGRADQEGICWVMQQMRFLPLLGFDEESEVDTWFELQYQRTVMNEEVLGSSQRHLMTCGDVYLTRTRRHEVAPFGRHGQDAFPISVTCLYTSREWER